jgi:cell division protein FtsB
VSRLDERLEAIRADSKGRARLLRYGTWIVAGLLLFNLVLGDMGVVAGWRQRHTTSVTRREVAEFEAENAALLADIKALKTDPFRIESIAREQLNLARPGEIIFLFPASPAEEPGSQKTRGKR